MRLQVSFALVLVVAGCGHNSSSTDGGDGGSGDMPAPVGDGGGDLAVVSTGNKVAPGTWLLAGVTSDDFAVVYDVKNGGLFTVPLAGGTPFLIDAKGTWDTGIASVRGRVVFSWRDVDPSSGVGNLTVWTAAGGSKVLSLDFSVAPSANDNPGVYAASDDGAYVIYTDRTSDDGAQADIYLAESSAQVGTKILDQQLTDASCFPQVGFAGGRFLISHCNAPGDGGAGLPVVSTVDPATGKVIDLKTGAANFFATDKAGTKVLVASAAGAATVVPIGGGNGLAIDSAVTGGLLTADGGGAIYRTVAGSLKRATVGASPMPMTLVGSAVKNFEALSGDGKFLLYSTNMDAQTGYTDLFLASTQAAGAPVTLAAGAKASLFGDAFTADRSRALFAADCTADYIGVIKAQAVTGGPVATLATSGYYIWATKGTQVIFNDHFVAPPNMLGNGRGDVLAADVASADPPSVLATQADVDIFLNAAKTKVVYTTNAVAGMEGLYAAPVP